MSQERFKIVGRYLYPDVESTETFSTKEIASEVNKKWTNEAEKQGMRWQGRVVPSALAQARGKESGP